MIDELVKNALKIREELRIGRSVKNGCQSPGERHTTCKNNDNLIFLLYKLGLQP